MRRERGLRRVRRLRSHKANNLNQSCMGTGQSRHIRTTCNRPTCPQSRGNKWGNTVACNLWVVAEVVACAGDKMAPEETQQRYSLSTPSGRPGSEKCNQYSLLALKQVTDTTYDLRPCSSTMNISIFSLYSSVNLEQVGCDVAPRAAKGWADKCMKI